MAAPDASPLEVLAGKADREFPSLFAARERTKGGLVKRSERLAGLRSGADVSVVLMGSWGRGEVTASSDDDFMLLVHGGAQGSRHLWGTRLQRAARTRHRPRRGRQQQPDEANAAHARVRAGDKSVKAYRPPRFFLNDVVRYWRTICVDFAGKEHEGPKKWGLRNAKLRTSRKILFAGGLLPVLECFRLDLPRIRDYLEGQLDMLPTDRIAESFLAHNAVEPGARTFGAYDEFVGRMDDPEFRDELTGIVRNNARDSAAFADVQRIGRELQDGLLALLYETRALPQVVRDYAIF